MLVWASPHMPENSDAERAKVNVIKGERDIPTSVIRQEASPSDNALKSVNLNPAQRPTRDIMRFNDGGDIRPLWGTDVLVRGGPSGYPADIAMDVADNGDIYVAVLMRGPSTNDDTIEIHKSTDGGSTWTETGLYIVGEIDGFDMVIGPGANPWIYTLVDWDSTSTSTSKGLFLRRIKPDLSAYNWYGIATSDTIEYPSMSVNNNGTLVITYITTTPDSGVYRGVSTDEGATWSTFWANAGVYAPPSIFISANDRAYHMYYTADRRIWLITFDAPTLSGTYVNTIDLAPDESYISSIAATGGAPSSQGVVAVWENFHTSTSVWDIHYATSNDGGNTWSAPGPFPPTNFIYSSGSNMWYPYVHRDRNDVYGSFRFVSTYATSSFDSVLYAFSSTHDGWGSTYDAVINDWDATISFGARVDYCPGASGGCVAYRQYASDSVWFDGYNFVIDVDEVVKNVKDLKDGEMYDILGRRINPSNAKKGIFFIRYKGKLRKVLIR